MAKIVIVNRWNGKVICEGEAEDIKSLLKANNNNGANLGGANLGGANLYGANLYGANLYGANLRGADLRGANLRGANLYGANLRGANLRGADLRGAKYGEDDDLGGADLRDADLRGANLRGANLYGANLRGANLRGADLRGADLYGAKYGEDDELLLKYVAVGPIGSRNDYLQVFITSKQTILKTGCFNGTVEGFKAAVARSHGESEHSKHYGFAVALVESMEAGLRS